jgi:DNA polymerase alpha subunit A
MSRKANVKDALSRLRENREGGVKRTDQYEVHEAEAIIEEVEEGEYDRVRRERAGNDFVVDDDGYGYADDGAEVWDDNELYSDQEDMDDMDLENVPGGRARKLRAQAMRDRLKNRKAAGGAPIPAFREKGQKSISSFIRTNQSAGAQPTAATGGSSMPSIRSTNVASNLDDLMKEFEDNIDNEEILLTTTRPQAVAQIKRVHAPVSQSSYSYQQPEHAVSAKKQRPTEGDNLEHPVEVPDIPDDSENCHQSPTDECAAPDPPQATKNSMDDILQSTKWASSDDAALEESSELAEVSFEASSLETGGESNVSSSQAPQVVPSSPGFDFYLIDVHEDQANSTVVLFGRIRTGSAGHATQSCCIVVKNIYRNVFFLHKDATESDDSVALKNSMEIFREFDSLRKSGRKPFADIKEFKIPKQLVRRNYAFELKNVPHGLLNFLKITYPSKFSPIPSDLKGETFSRVFGSNTSLTELLLVKCKIQGPSWLRISGAERQDKRGRSWCKEEYIMDFGGLKSKQFKPISVITENCPEPPRLSVLGLSVKSVVGNSTSGSNSWGASREVASVAMCFAPSVKLESNDNEIRFDSQNGRFCAVRMQEGRALPRREVDQLTSMGIQVLDEKPLLSLVCSKIQQLDPDIIIGHNVFGNELDVLSSRLAYYGLKVWHRISRLQRNDEPNPPRVKNGNTQWPGRQFTLGRLVCDTYLNARELVRESNYELGNLSRSLLGIDRQPHPIPSHMIAGGDSADVDTVVKMCTGTMDGMRALADHTLCDALLSIRIAWKLQVLPLTRQLTNLAGNLWSNSLLNKRAERNEWLLVHEFKRLKYIVPDKQVFGGASKSATKSAAQVFEEDFNEENEAEQPAAATGATTFKRKKAAAYMGGLVLEPKAGLYDKLVLLLDFNSLYPSIIREYNICFTTVERLDGEAAAAAETAEDVIPSHPQRGLEDGVLPRVITRLVNSRRAVKQMLKSEKNESNRMNLDIRQQALKLTANSMYGCLGFSSSRFYAKPIASLITWTGRQTLQATVDLVEKNLRLDVVYGDTDSIFVHTGQDDFSAALAIGSEISKEVNKRYTKLEIELDGVFRSLLLLKKKKYAGLKVKDWDKQFFEREQKGLDMVRRDWCVMSKTLGGSILDQLLSPNKTKEDSIQWLEEFLRSVGKQMDSKQVPLTEYIITKGITKMPDEYPDAKNQPHVLVAKRRIQAGERIRPGNEIPYIICAIDESQDGPLSIAERARSPDEAMRLGLEPDVAWYKAQQIHPPIARLCAPTQLADSGRIAEWLGLDPSRFSGGNDNGGTGGEVDEMADLFINNEEAKIDVDIKYKDFDTSRLGNVLWKCGKCKVALNLISAIRSPVCLKCGEEKIETSHIRNLLCLVMRDIQNKALLGWAKCANEDCGAITRQVTVEGGGDHCFQENCGGRLKAMHFTSKDLHQHLVFLQELTTKYRPEATDVVLESIEANAYDTINLMEVFACLTIRGG